MPKKIEYENKPRKRMLKSYEGNGEEDDEEEIEDESLEEEEQQAPKGRGRPTKKDFHSLPRVTDIREGVRRPVTPRKEETPQKQRFMAFRTPERIGVMDSETGEVISEGEFAVLQNQALILERLERIENTLGNMLSR